MRAGTERGWRSRPRIRAASTRTLYGTSLRTRDSSTSSICGVCARTGVAAPASIATINITTSGRREWGAYKACSGSLDRVTAVNENRKPRYDLALPHIAWGARLGDIVRATAHV